jgi:hypothetical protein
MADHSSRNMWPLDPARVQEARKLIARHKPVGLKERNGRIYFALNSRRRLAYSVDRRSGPLGFITDDVAPFDWVHVDRGGALHVDASGFICVPDPEWRG